MMKSKKIIIIMIMVSLVTSLFIGCSKKDTPSTKGNAEGNVESTGSNHSNDDKQLTITYWTGVKDSPELKMKDMNDNIVYQELEKKTGVHIEFIHPPSGQGKEQFNLMLASDDLPDVIQDYSDRYPGGPDKAIEDGVYLRLNELIGEYAPNLQKLIDDNPEIAKQIMTDEGNIWSFPAIQVNEEPAWAGPMLRGDWIEELGLEIPTTINEWEIVLRAFKEEKGAQVPLYLDYGWNSEWVGAFSGAYGVTGTFFNKNGTVKYGPIEEGYREYLTTMNRWYKEGLLDSDYVTRDKKSREALMTTDDVGSFVEAYGVYGYFDALMKDHPTFKLIPTPYPTLEKGGDVQFRITTNHVKGNQAVITTACKNPEEVVKWFDYAYSDEGAMLFNYGIEGLTYNMVEGKPEFTELMTNNPDGIDFFTLAWKYKLHIGPYKRDWAAVPAFSESVAKSMDIWTASGSDYVMPELLKLTKEEGKVFSGKMNEIKTYVDEMTHKFIMGVEPLDKFDEYVKQVNKMGIDELIKIKQASLDRYINR